MITKKVGVLYSTPNGEAPTTLLDIDNLYLMHEDKKLVDASCVSMDDIEKLYRLGLPSEITIEMEEIGSTIGEMTTQPKLINLCVVVVWSDSPLDKIDSVTDTQIDDFIERNGGKDKDELPVTSDAPMSAEEWYRIHHKEYLVNGTFQISAMLDSYAIYFREWHEKNKVTPDNVKDVIEKEYPLGRDGDVSQSLPVITTKYLNTLLQKSALFGYNLRPSDKADAIDWDNIQQKYFELWDSPHSIPNEHNTFYWFKNEITPSDKHLQAVKKK